jgi:hypothetical protein
MANAPARSAGVTAAATYAILCCATALGFWGYIMLGAINGPADDQGRHFYNLFPIVFTLVLLLPPAVIAMGIRTAVGLLFLRSWARRTSLIWAAISLLLCLAIIAFRPFETFVIPQHFVSQVVLTKQMISISFVLILFPVSVWWLFYFRTRSVKMQFLAASQSSGASETN